MHALIEEKTPVRRVAPLVLLLFCLVPAFQSYLAVTCSFHPRVTYPLLKGMIFFLPIMVWLWQGLTWRQLRTGLGLGWPTLLRGPLVGLVMAGAILATYYGFFAGNTAPDGIVAKLQGFGLTGAWGYWGMAIFISLANAALEEYFWRGFVHMELGRHLKSPLVICLLGGGLFGIHHYFLVGSYFPVGMALILTVGTALAGAIWCWQRSRGHSLMDCYISHVLADLAVLWCGWEIVSTLL